MARSIVLCSVVFLRGQGARRNHMRGGGGRGGGREEEEREEEKGGEREYFGRDRQISIGYAKWAGERLFTVMAGGRWLFPTKHGLQYCLGCRLRFRDVHFTVD